MNLLVTGGTRGLGLAIVEHQLSLGHQVWAAGRSCSDPLKRLIDQSAGRCRFVECDLAQPADAIREQLQAGVGDAELDGLVNNAGVSHVSLITELNAEAIEAMFRVNVVSAMEVTRWVLRRMLNQGRGGSVVFVSSVTTRHGSRGLSAYAASKGALEAFSLTLAQEWGSRGIRSNCVVPGYLDTGMTEALSESQRDRIARRSALKKQVSMESVVQTVGFLLSDAAESVTGQCWEVDCGARG